MVSVLKEIGSKGEIVIPKKIRKDLGIEKKSKIEVIQAGELVVLRPIKRDFSDIVGLFKNKSTLSYEELDMLTQEIMYGI